MSSHCELADGGRSCSEACGKRTLHSGVNCWSWDWMEDKLVLVDAVLSVCCTRFMLILHVCCTWCQLMIMTWRDREGWLNFVFCNDGRVVDEKERDMGWRWERCGGYERITEIRGTTYLIRFRRPHIGVITHRIGTRTCSIGVGKLTPTQNSL